MKHNFNGVLFDMDGVITFTIQQHFQAWKKIFDEFLKEWTLEKNSTYRPFKMKEDYLPYVDGQPRYKGVQHFLESRSIHIPLGEPDDNITKKTICGLGNKKNYIFNKLIQENGVKYNKKVIALVKQFKKEGIKTAIVTSSKNGKKIINIIKKEHLFDTIVDGVIAGELKLNGKPDPDIFVTAAEKLGLKPSDCIIFEDASSGIKAGNRGHFILNVGVAMNQNKLQLYQSGADQVITDFQQVNIKKLDQWIIKKQERHLN